MIKLDKIFSDEDGFSTLSVVVALLISLSLIFSSAQVYNISSASADIQNVADAGAEAAENQVAEFMIAVRVVDSVSLSLTLGGLVVMGVGIVCICIPFTAAAGEELIDAANKMFDARDKFADKASAALNKLQNILPYISTVKSFQVARANNGGTLNANYLAISLLMPGEGKTIEPGNIDDVKGTANDVNNNKDQVEAEAAAAEEAAKRANEAKYRAFMADTGQNPGYCMEDRARDLAYVPEYYNPHYSSVDSWDFSVALSRAQKYYAYRWQNDKPTGSSAEAQADYWLRRHYFVYAYQEMQKGYVHSYGDTYDCYFPHLACKTSEMRDTWLFNDVYFPVTQSGDRLVMHAWKGCPGCTSINLTQNAITYDNNKSQYDICPYCGFTSDHFGSVASATTNATSGFEHWYKVVEEASKDYMNAKNEGAPHNSNVKNRATDWFNKIKQLITSVASKRIYAKPPGSYGAICLVVNTSSAAASSGFETSFVSDAGSVGVRFAVSGATLIEESAESGKSVVSQITSGLANSAGGLSGIAGVALTCWSKLLEAYTNGQNALTSGLESLLNNFSFNSASGLGTWAKKTISSTLSSVGLEPANINALKPVLVNTNYIASKAGSESASTTMGNASKTFATKYLAVRKVALQTEDVANSVLSNIASSEEISAMLNLQAAQGSTSTFEIATIQPLGSWGPSIPITISLPSESVSVVAGWISWAASCVQNVVNAVSGGKVWR